MNMAELEQASTEVQRFFERQRLGQAELFISFYFKEEVTKIRIADLTIDSANISGKIITQNKQWNEYRKDICKEIEALVSNSIYDIEYFNIYDAFPIILFQLFDEDDEDPIEHKIDMRKGSGEQEPTGIMGRIKPPAKITVTRASEPPSLRPRWAEENRPKKQVKLRLQPELIDEIDTSAKQDGKNRNDWIEAAIRHYLDAKPG